MKQYLKMSFENLETGEHRNLIGLLYLHSHSGEGNDYYQVLDCDQKPLAEAGNTKQEAMDNFINSYIPKAVWGWRDVAYLSWTFHAMQYLVKLSGICMYSGTDSEAAESMYSRLMEQVLEPGHTDYGRELYLYEDGVRIAGITGK